MSDFSMICNVVDNMMYGVVINAASKAVNKRWSDFLFGNPFDDSIYFDPRRLLPVLLFLLSLLLIFIFWRWVRTRAKEPKPLGLFHEIATELNLALADQWLLVRIARQQNLPSPLALMLSAQTLHHHAQAFAQSLSTGRRQRILAQVESIRAALFGE